MYHHPIAMNCLGGTPGDFQHAHLRKFKMHGLVEGTALQEERKRNSDHRQIEFAINLGPQNSEPLGGDMTAGGAIDTQSAQNLGANRPLWPPAIGLLEVILVAARALIMDRFSVSYPVQ
jgi:hypothetical protein